MTKTSILLYGTSRQKINSWAKEMQAKGEEYGAELRGPISYPPISTEWSDEGPQHQCRELERFDGCWFHEINHSEEDVEALYPAPGSNAQKTVFGRAIELENDRAAAKILEINLDGDVFLQVSFDKSVFPESTGNEPSGYDPAKDYVTDTDFDAHHGD